MIALAVGAVVAGEPWFGWYVLALVLASYVESFLLMVKATQNLPFRLADLLAGEKAADKAGDRE